LADILGQVANTFELARDAQNSDNFAQVDGQRLPSRDSRDCPLLNRALLGVKYCVVSNNAGGTTAITFQQGSYGMNDLSFGKSTHLCNHTVQFLQIGIEGIDCMFGGRDEHQQSLPQS